MSKPAWLSKKLNNGKIICQAYKLGVGEYSICSVRKVKNGELKLLVYGLAAAVNVDPVEKKPMFHFLPSSTAFSVGTVGCNFLFSLKLLQRIISINSFFEISQSFSIFRSNPIPIFSFLCTGTVVQFPFSSFKKW